MSFIVFCPLAAVVCILVGQKAKHNYDVSTYVLEKKKLEYRVYSNFNPVINYSIYAIDFLNFSWALIGLMFNDYYASALTKKGAIRDCTRDYGIFTPIIAYCLILIGVLQISRLIIYLGALIYHR